jgi:hypothetical protein
LEEEQQQRPRQLATMVSDLVLYSFSVVSDDRAHSSRKRFSNNYKLSNNEEEEGEKPSFFRRNGMSGTA